MSAVRNILRISRLLGERSPDGMNQNFQLSITSIGLCRLIRVQYEVKGNTQSLTQLLNVMDFHAKAGGTKSLCPRTDILAPRPAWLSEGRHGDASGSNAIRGHLLALPLPKDELMR